MDHASPSRSLVKTMTWRLIATTDTFLLTFLAASWFGTDMGISGGEATTLAATVASLEIVTKMALCFRVKCLVFSVFAVQREYGGFLSYLILSK